MSYDHDRVLEVLKSRAREHGDALVGGTQLGRTWAALLSDHFKIVIEDIPPHVVYLMLSSLKTHRAVRPQVYNEDDYVDIHGYAHLAKELQEGTS